MVAHVRFVYFKHHYRQSELLPVGDHTLTHTACLTVGLGSLNEFEVGGKLHRCNDTRYIVLSLKRLGLRKICNIIIFLVSRGETSVRSVPIESGLCEEGKITHLNLG